MPNRWPISSGNWSNAAIWNGGLGVPTASDDIFANNQAVYIDTNITVLSLRNAASASAILGSGSFYLNNGVTASLTAANPLFPAAPQVPVLIISQSNSARLQGSLIVATSTGTSPVIVMSGSSNLTISGSFQGHAAIGPATNASGSIIHNSSGSLIITGSITANPGAAGYCSAIVMNGEGSTYITGSLNGAGSVSSGIAKLAGSGSIFIITSTLSTNTSGGPITKSSFGNITITGNVAGSAGSNAIINSAGGTITINGNCSGGGSFFNGITNTGANVLITVTGSVIGVGNTAYGINNTGANSIIIISGSVLGGTSTAAGISIGSNVTLTVTGSVAGSNTAAAIITTTATTIRITGSSTAGIGGSAVSATAAGIIEITGPVSSSTAFPGVQSTSATATNIFTGPFYNVNNRNAVFAPNIQLISGSTPTWTFDTETNLEQRTLYTQNYPGNFPSTTDVRDGVVFGDTNQFTGTVAIPSTGSVLKGVPVDNTTGSASFDTQSVWSIDTNLLTTTGSLGQRLRNVATVTATGDAIASKGNL
jgi:hypothetical protein